MSHIATNQKLTTINETLEEIGRTLDSVNDTLGETRDAQLRIARAAEIQAISEMLESDSIRRLGLDYETITALQKKQRKLLAELIS